MRFACWMFALAAITLFAVEYTNIAPASGIRAVIPNGGTESKQYILETTGSGVALFDYNDDGRLDAFVVSGPGGTNRLYLNQGARRFVDVTEQIGITGSGWGQGVCAGDFNNDGFVDLFVTYWGQNKLLRNVQARRFEDVTRQSGLLQKRTRYNTGCAFVDYDRDGDLDLFVANYLKFDLETAPKPGANPYCFYRGLAVNCGPRGLAFDQNLLYRNDGDGVFTDVSASSGVAAPNSSYCLGVLTADFNNDGWADVYVACDQTPSLLFMNQKNGTFREEGLLRGVALDEHGKALSGMGATAADYDGDGWLDIFRTNFSDERETLYRNRGKADFEETTQIAGMARNTRFVGWGCGFLDFDNDGWKDLMLVNGHAFPEVDRLKIDIQYRDRAIVYRNTGKAAFEDVSEVSGPAVIERHSARGLAIGDIDSDGSPEVLVNNQNEAPSLWRASPSQGNWIFLRLIGVRSNRSAIGARVRVTAGGRTQTDEVRSGGSYLSQGDLRLHFGLGTATKVDRIEIDWPAGSRTVLVDQRVNVVRLVTESK